MIVCLSTVITVVAAAFYNLFAEIMGGVVITVVEEDDAGSEGSVGPSPLVRCAAR